MITLQQILQEFKEFVEQHYELYTYSFGPVSNIGTKDTNYPMIHLSPTNTFSQNGRLLIGMDMYVLDLQKQDYSNLETIISSTLQIGNDAIARFFNNDLNGWSIDNDVQIAPTEFAFDDVLAGWIFTIKLEIENPYNNCDLPLQTQDESVAPATVDDVTISTDDDDTTTTTDDVTISTDDDDTTTTTDDNNNNISLGTITTENNDTTTFD